MNGKCPDYGPPGEVFYGCSVYEGELERAGSHP